MSDIIPSSEYGRLLLENRPLIDVRAPVEFTKGAFPHSVNLPLMQDDERTKVGTCYKQHGQDAAIALGHQLVTGNVKQARIEAWRAQLLQHPESYLYCFRGGLRSKLSQQWIKDAGVKVPFIQGGYKAMRSFLIGTINNAPQQTNMLILSGITGSGKTEFIHQRAEAVDLEGLANHRGSSFGKNIEPQPTQINFENNLAISLLKHQQQQHRHLLLEDESYLIGRSALPHAFYQAMQQADIVLLDEPRDIRLPRLLKDYVTDKLAGYIVKFGEQDGVEAFSHYLSQSLTGIRKRLGGKQYQELQLLVDEALLQQQNQNDASKHLDWISLLLEVYYDPMYQFQLEKKRDRVIFQGDRQAIHQWLDTRNAM
ncbi:tRNA 2-selenouridine(34) synthase MnmH [Shewanella inventionis]|uniref:tRNA 2-selenouridine synthase n=1 Tax=Shewanella inventionis TaxID=1738770 RepID=A0ABQ1JPY4_9GAMM|nr:tRNA 2-selenouridine(34) synthase MnmH [Shewanella inventionis]MCL1159111.1 tRNA 2-selenouridine(34) synthase MnmH [Shewanella inventionis]UAL43823.1 tRNA 2-selenouridine(34) synthase MnmH [Shewanella inventionis]GGB71728.1 tRNA 2-selenouridine synthase [Shewanella inventionis]